MDQLNLWTYVWIFTLISVPMGIVMGAVQTFLLPLNTWLSRKLWTWIFAKFGDPAVDTKVEGEKLPK